MREDEEGRRRRRILYAQSVPPLLAPMYPDILARARLALGESLEYMNTLLEPGNPHEDGG